MSRFNERPKRQACTANAGGTGAGPGGAIIADNTDYANITSANAAHLITLPTPAVGWVVGMYVAATGFELQTDDPANTGLNGGIGASARSAIPPDTEVICHVNGLGGWFCTNTATNGTVTTTEAAA